MQSNGRLWALSVDILSGKVISKLTLSQLLIYVCIMKGWPPQSRRRSWTRPPACWHPNFTLPPSQICNNRSQFLEPPITWLFIMAAWTTWCHPWVACLGCYKKVDWERQEEQASKKHFSMTSASVPTSRVWPYLSFCPNFPGWSTTNCKEKKINPFLLSLFLASVFYQSNIKHN